MHCKGFAPAAPRKARVLISVPFSGLPLSRPVRILGLVGSYPANSLIRRSPILKQVHLHGVPFFGKRTFQYLLSMELYAQFPGFDSSLGQASYVLLSRMPETPVAVPLRLAWLNRTSIAVSASRISWNRI